MMTRTIERLRSAGAWMRHPAGLIDMFLDQIEKLSIALAMPSQPAALLPSEAPVEAHLGKNLGV